MSQQGEVWEPWVPAPGTRVRIRLTAECPLYHYHDMPGLDGMTGTVEYHHSQEVLSESPLSWRHHSIVVELDQRLVSPRFPEWLGWHVSLAAAELELLAGCSREGSNL